MTDAPVIVLIIGASAFSCRVASAREVAHVAASRDREEDAQQQDRADDASDHARGVEVHDTLVRDEATEEATEERSAHAEQCRPEQAHLLITGHDGARQESDDEPEDEEE
jgi:hypothetical protein